MSSTAKKIRPYAGRRQVEALTNAVLGKAIRNYAGNSVQRLMGYWFMVSAYGSFQALVESKLLSQGGVYTQRKEFRQMFGVDVEEFLPEIAAAIRKAQRPQ